MEFVRIISETKHKRISLIKDEEHYRILKEINQPYTTRIYEQLFQNPHEGLPTILSVEPTPSKIKIIEEYVEGCVLSDVSKALSVTQKDELFLKLLEAVRHIHSLDPPVIHRDIKPENIMIDAGKIKLIDFEIARTPNHQSKDTQVLGSVGYAAPEQFGFSQSDERTDIYALGVVYNVLMTNCLPNEKISDHNRILVEKSTLIDPNKRYQTVDEMLMDLEVNQLEKEKKKKYKDQNLHLFIKIAGYSFYSIFSLAISLRMNFENSTHPLMDNLLKIIVFTDLMLMAYLAFKWRKMRMPWKQVLLRCVLIWIVIFFVSMLPLVIIF